MNFNKVILGGNITRDIDLRTLPGGSVVADFGLAINRRYTTGDGEKREEVTFVDCTAFGKTAETIGNYFAKGSPILIEGRLKLDSWEDKTTGAKRSRLSVVLDRFEFVGGKKDDGEAPPVREPRQIQDGARRQAARAAPKAIPAGVGTDEVPPLKDYDIPF